MKVTNWRRKLASLLAGGACLAGGVVANNEAANAVIIWSEDFESHTAGASMLLEGSQGYNVENYYSTNAETTVFVRTIADLDAPNVTAAHSGNYVVSGFRNDGTGANDTVNGLDSACWWWVDGGIGANYVEGVEYTLSFWSQANVPDVWGSLWFWEPTLGWLAVGNNDATTEWQQHTWTYTANAAQDGQPIDFRIYNYPNAAIDGVVPGSTPRKAPSAVPLMIGAMLCFRSCRVG